MHIHAHACTRQLHKIAPRYKICPQISVRVERSSFFLCGPTVEEPKKQAKPHVSKKQLEFQRELREVPHMVEEASRLYACYLLENRPHRETR